MEDFQHRELRSSDNVKVLQTRMPSSSKPICATNQKKHSENGGKSSTSEQGIKDGGWKNMLYTVQLDLYSPSEEDKGPLLYMKWKLYFADI